jgi:hypothetical protein
MDAHYPGSESVVPEQDAWDRSYAILVAWAEVLEIFVPAVSSRSQAERLRESLQSTAIKLMEAALCDNFEAMVKDTVKVLHAWAMGKRIVYNKSQIAFEGSLLRLLKRRCARANGTVAKMFRNCSKTCMNLIRSLYEAKRCCLKASVAVELKARADHKQVMQEERVTDEEMRDALRAATRIVFPPGTKYRPGACVPTFASCFENSLSKGGNHSFVSLDRKIDLGYSGLVEDTSAEPERSCLEASLAEDNRVAYQAIPEPCKVRIITKGRANLYTGLRRLQKFMVRRWKNTPFGTMTSEFEEKLKFRLESDSMLNDGDYYISGDYSSATDRMNLDATQLVMEEILRNCGLLGTLLAERALFSFSGAHIEYPDGDIIQQCRGQLMGHPLSFPILCIINLATYMKTFDRWDSLELTRSPFMINGDDILFRGDQSHMDLWRGYSARVGLSVNEEKTYVHSKYYLINSVLGKRGSGKVNYYNRALAIGHGVKSEPVRLVTQADSLWKALEHPLPRAEKRGRRHLLETLQIHLKKFTSKGFTPNYFLPKVVGGLGLTSDERQISMTYTQRKVATYFMRNPYEQALIEKLGDKPYSVEEALKHVRKMKPSFISTRMIGPFPEFSDFDSVLDSYLHRALQFTAWQKNTKPKTDVEIRRLAIFRALKHKEKLASDRKILQFSLLRRMIPDFNNNTTTDTIALKKIESVAASSGGECY